MFASEPFNGFLNKPYTRDDLWRTLVTFINIKKPGSAEARTAHKATGASRQTLPAASCQTFGWAKKKWHGFPTRETISS